MGISSYIGETTEYDKKLTLEERKPRSWLKSVSAFANGNGGVLFFGVADDDTPVGISDVKSASETISELLKSRMDPIPEASMEIHREDGKEFLLLRVSAGAETPYYYVGDGSRVAYIRVGNESVPATAMDLKRLVLKGNGQNYDGLLSRYHTGDCAFTKLRSTYKLRTGQELDESDFISFGLIGKNGVLTNAGALLADEPLVRHSRLFCTRWNGLDKASGVVDALDDKEFEGSLISLLQNGEEFVKNNSKKRWRKTGDGRVEMPDYPEQAVHEVIVNALIHRDYLDTGSEVHIDIYDDRLEVYSPGGMYDGSIVQELDTDRVPSRRRNPVIADVFSRMHLMERRGSGFRKIKSDYKSAIQYDESLAPVFQSTRNAFFVTLYNLNYSVQAEKTGIAGEKQACETSKTGIADEKQAFEKQIEKLSFTGRTTENIRKLFEQYGTSTAFSHKDIMSVIGLTASPATGLLNKMKAAEIIEPVKDQGRGKYRFKIGVESKS